MCACKCTAYMLPPANSSCGYWMSQAQLCPSRSRFAESATHCPASSGEGDWQFQGCACGTNAVGSEKPYSSRRILCSLCCSAKRFTSGSDWFQSLPEVKRFAEQHRSEEQTSELQSRRELVC